MIVRYRELCQKNARARAKLRDALEASSLSDAHKKALLEGNASSACRGIVPHQLCAVFGFFSTDQHFYQHINNHPC